MNSGEFLLLGVVSLGNLHRVVVNLCENMTHYGTFSNNSFLLNVPLIGQGCVLSPLLYALYTYDYTYDCTLFHQSNTNHQVC